MTAEGTRIGKPPVVPEKKKIPLMKRVNVQDFLVELKRPRVCENPDCRKPWVVETYVSERTGRKIQLPVPGCNCMEEIMRNRERREEEARLHRQYVENLMKSNLPVRCRMNDYEIPSAPVRQVEYDTVVGEEVVKVLLEYDKILDAVNHPLKYFEEYRGLFLPGNPGTRKTGYIGEFGKSIMRAGKTCKYYQVAEIIQQGIKVDDLLLPDVLLLDDLGNNVIETRNDIVWTAMNKRIDMGLFTVVVTNFSQEHNRKMFGDAFMDRLNLFYPIAMIGPSSRTYEREKKEEE